MAIDQQTKRYFSEMKMMLEPVYLSGETPWNQSGFAGTKERWDRLRHPIAACIHRAGRYLDIGCANGYLMECVQAWAAARGVRVEPYGVDISEEFVQLAKRRLPQWAERFYVGNAWSFVPPQVFDYVSTELVYVPEELRRDYVRRLLDVYVAEGGTLLVSEYRPSKDADNPHWANDHLPEWGFAVEQVKVGIDVNGNELTRVSVVRKGLSACHLPVHAKRDDTFLQMVAQRSDA